MIVSAKTKNKASLNMYNKLASYLFEQECEELKECSTKEKAVLEEALSILWRIVLKGKDD